MLGVVVVATAVTALVARNVYQLQSAGAATSPPVTSVTQTPVAPTKEPGSTQVSMTPDVANSPDGQQVRQLMQTLFDSINNRRYGQWLSVVTTQLAQNKSETNFMDSYKSTSDGAIQILRIDTAPQGGLSVLVTFHSVQSLDQAPAYAPYGCIQWQVVWPVVQVEDGSLKLDTGATGESPQTQQCA